MNSFFKNRFFRCSFIDEYPNFSITVAGEQIQLAVIIVIHNLWISSNTSASIQTYRLIICHQGLLFLKHWCRISS